MLNAEKYRSQVLDIIEEGRQFAVSKDRQNIVRCTVDFSCGNCIFGGENDCGYSLARMKWLLSEYKEPIKLTRLEFEILKWLDKEDYKFIVRNPGGNLMIYYDTPEKDVSFWFYDSGCKILSGFNELFQFVQWEDIEPTSIQDVLKNCEVEDDTDKR